MEPSGQFLLDIPKWMHVCAHHIGQVEVADLVKMHIALLVKRTPKLMQLSFESNDAFVSSTTAAWLEQLDQQSQSSGTASEQNSLNDYLNHARNVAQEQNIQEAFKSLMLLPQSNDLEVAYVEFCKAQLCVEQDRSELALPILLQLEKTVDYLSLAKVAPEFAMQVWRQLHRLLKDRTSSEEQEQSKAEMENHIAHLQSLMCTTDIASAMQWL
jgi:type VI secretion system protein VasJ